MAVERNKKCQLTGVADDRLIITELIIIINRTLLLHTLTKTAFAAFALPFSISRWVIQGEIRVNCFLHSGKLVFFVKIYC